ncbi:MAG TPA: hypothetical protein VEI96_03295 [Thermodesulfovibrionales bacterium]|nr:hypothetical protein [Thermodesulfovibrionales bacterium]
MGDGRPQDEILSLRAEIKRLRKSLSELTPPLTVLLKRRGFTIYKKEPQDDLLLPEERFVDDYYRILNKYSFRLFLRDVIKHQELFTLRDVTRYATQGVTKDYTEYLESIGLIGKRVRAAGEGADIAYRLSKGPVKSFGVTLEWFIAEIFKREFAAEAVWGVKCKRPVVGGDYDLIAKIDGSILYGEVKSSPPKQIYANEIAAFLTRAFDMKPEITLFFMDTELRMKDKIVPIFEEELGKRPSHEITGFFGKGRGAVTALRGERIEKELFHIEDKIFIINAKESIAGNIERVLRWFFRRSL